jgi:cell filamentation protein
MSSGFSKYDRKPITQSLYCYPGTEVLINKENIRDAQALADYEADITIIRQYELEVARVVKGKFGITHLQRIHKYIFQDIYPFAGKFRTEDISKGSTDFCKCEYIADNESSVNSKTKII